MWRARSEGDEDADADADAEAEGDAAAGRKACDIEGAFYVVTGCSAHLIWDVVRK